MTSTVSIPKDPARPLSPCLASKTAMASSEKLANLCATVALPAWLLLSLRPWRPRRRRGWPALGSCPSPCCWRDMVKAVEPDLLRCLPYWTYKQISSGLILSILSQYRQRSGERTALLPVEACQLNAIRTSCKLRTKKNSPDTKLNSGKLVKRANFR